MLYAVAAYYVRSDGRLILVEDELIIAKDTKSQLQRVSYDVSPSLQLPTK